ncbi:MAG: ABC transporter ATP-binding protein [Spirochaetales bacterium]|nr:ABC transporter ATP-binding protein [Spirochaetales bacterium]
MKSFIRILRYMKPYLLFAVIGPLLMLVEVAMDLAQPRLIQDIVDIGLKTMDNDFIIRTGLIMVGVALVGLLGGAGCSLFSTIAGISMGTDIRHKLYSKIQELSLGEIDAFSAGSLINRLTNDIVQVQDVAVMMLRILVRAPLLILGSIVMVIIINPQLSLILLVLIPFLVLAVILLIRKSFPLFNKVQTRLDELNVVTRENLNGVRVIKAFVREENENKKFSYANSRLMEMMQKASRVIVLITPLMILLLNGGIALALYYGGYLVSTGDAFSTGQLIAFINYLVQLLMSLMMVSMVLVRFSRAEVSAERIMEVLDTVPGLIDPALPVRPQKAHGKLVFENVSFCYAKGNKERYVLDDISFSLEPGSVAGIIGTTGSGKSTLVNLIPRMYDVSAGRILLDGMDIQSFSREDLRSRLGIVPQKALLFTGTIGENIAYGRPDAGRQSILEAAEIAQIMDFIGQTENGLDTLLFQGGVNLSGGQKQRLCIARAVLYEPEILILDESTSALDADTSARLQKALRIKRKNSTTIIIGQRISAVMDADTIIVLDDGKIIDNAPHNVLIKRCTLYREIIASQDERFLHE